MLFGCQLGIAAEEQMDEDVTSSVLLAYSVDGWSVSLDSCSITGVISTKSLVSSDTEQTELTGVASPDEVLQTSVTLSCSGNEGKEICEDVALTQLLIESVLFSFMSIPENISLFIASLCLPRILAKERRSKGTSATETENTIFNLSPHFVQISSLTHKNSETSATYDS